MELKKTKNQRWIWDRVDSWLPEAFPFLAKADCKRTVYFARQTTRIRDVRIERNDGWYERWYIESEQTRKGNEVFGIQFAVCLTPLCPIPTGKVGWCGYLDELCPAVGPDLRDFWFGNGDYNLGDAVDVMELRFSRISRAVEQCVLPGFDAVVEKLMDLPIISETMRFVSGFRTQTPGVWEPFDKAELIAWLKSAGFGAFDADQMAMWIDAR